MGGLETRPPFFCFNICFDNPLTKTTVSVIPFVHVFPDIVVSTFFVTTICTPSPNRFSTDNTLA